MSTSLLNTKTETRYIFCTPFKINIKIVDTFYSTQEIKLFINWKYTVLITVWSNSFQKFIFYAFSCYVRCCSRYTHWTFTFYYFLLFLSEINRLPKHLTLPLSARFILVLWKCFIYLHLSSEIFNIVYCKIENQY